MKLVCLLVLVVMLHTAPVHYVRDALAGVPIHEARIDLMDPPIRVTVVMAKGESFSSMCQRTHPLVAIDGDFFDTVTLRPCGDIVIDGKYVYDGCIGPAFIIPQKGPPQILLQGEYDRLDKSTLKLGMQTGPTLVRNGRMALNVAKEGFHIARYAIRVALGLTSKHELVLVVTEVPVSLTKLAEIMVRAGCDSAVCLDGGSSSALFVAGKIKVSPGRRLVSILVAKNR
jgi:exopolysaccharide biosynthesis protein